MALITLSQCKALLNITDSSQDSQLQLLTNVASQAIYKYIGMTIEATDNTDYICVQSAQSRYYPINTPILKVTKVQELQDSIDITSTTTCLLNITETEAIINSNTYTLATYSNVSSLFAAISLIETNITYSIPTNTEIIPAIDLIPTTINIEANQEVSLTGFLQDTGTSYNYNPLYISVLSGKYRIKYRSGYNTIPEDLQYVCARVVQDMLNIQTTKVDPNLKSESITNYSYTRGDIDLRSIVSNYAGMLDNYKNPCLFGSADIFTFSSENQFINYWGT